MFDKKMSRSRRTKQGKHGVPPRRDDPCPLGYVIRRANAGARCWEPTVTTEGSNCNPSFLYYKDLQSAKFKIKNISLYNKKLKVNFGLKNLIIHYEVITNHLRHPRDLYIYWEYPVG